MATTYLFVNRINSVSVTMYNDNCITGSLEITSPCSVYIDLLPKSDCY